MFDEILVPGRWRGAADTGPFSVAASVLLRVGFCLAAGELRWVVLNVRASRTQLQAVVEKERREVFFVVVELAGVEVSQRRGGRRRRLQTRAWQRLQSGFSRRLSVIVAGE